MLLVDGRPSTHPPIVAYGQQDAGDQASVDRIRVVSTTIPWRRKRVNRVWTSGEEWSAGQLEPTRVCLAVAAGLAAVGLCEQILEHLLQRRVPMC